MTNELTKTLIAIGTLGLVGYTMNTSSLINADLTNSSARNLSSEVFKRNGENSRENAQRFLRSIGYQNELKNDQDVYFRPVVDGFRSNKIQIVIAPKMPADNKRVREGNLLFDAYTQNPMGSVVASFTRNELVEKGYSKNIK